MKPYYEHKGVTIYHGDCREVLPGLKADLVLTDLPYGIDENYLSYDDSVSNLERLIAETLPLIMASASTALVSCGTRNLWKYPEPRWVLNWIILTGNGCGPWGFICCHPILAYGPDPYLAESLGSRPDVYMDYSGTTRSVGGHPCDKPLGIWKWLVKRGSVAEGDLVLDPFMGSGTTLRAAKDLGRRAIGIDIEEKYCEIAAKRLSQEVLDFSSEVK